MTEAIVAVTIALILPAVGMEVWRWYELKFNAEVSGRPHHETEKE